MQNLMSFFSQRQSLIMTAVLAAVSYGQTAVSQIIQPEYEPVPTLSREAAAELQKLSQVDSVAYVVVIGEGGSIRPLAVPERPGIIVRQDSLKLSLNELTEAQSIIRLRFTGSACEVQPLGGMFMIFGENPAECLVKP